MALYDHIFTIQLRSNPPKRYKKVKIEPEFRWSIWQRDNFTCQYCGTRKLLAIDHIIPESRGGILEESNVVTACENCNSKKGSRTPEEAEMPLYKDPRT
ncbi:HNH endonuclease [compost metagenome]